MKTQKKADHILEMAGIGLFCDYFHEKNIGKKCIKLCINLMVLTALSGVATVGSSKH